MIAQNRSCASGVCDAERTQGLIAPVAKGEHTLVTLDGPGLFVAAQITKQGSSSGLTFVDLSLDGRNITNLSFAAARTWALTQANPLGIVLLSTTTAQTLTIGFAMPLHFDTSLTLKVNITEDGVSQILGNVIHGR